MGTLLHNLKQALKAGYPALHQVTILKQHPSAVLREPGHGYHGSHGGVVFLFAVVKSDYGGQTAKQTMFSFQGAVVVVFGSFNRYDS